MLELLSHYDYFKSYPDFEKLAKEKKNSTDYYYIQINTGKFDIPDNFGIIYFDELEKTLNFKEELKGVKVNDEEIDLLRMFSSYILLLLSYLRVNMNRNINKQLCCYRLYQKNHRRYWIIGALCNTDCRNIRCNGYHQASRRETDQI